MCRYNTFLPQVHELLSYDIAASVFRLAAPEGCACPRPNGEVIMPRYFFDISDRAGFHRDEFGDEFDTIEKAREQAQMLLPDIAQEELPDGELHRVACEVRDETGAVIYRGELTYRGHRF